MNVLPTRCQRFLVPVFFLLASTSSTSQMCRSSRMRTYIFLARNAPPHSPTAPWIPSLSTTPPLSKIYPSVQLSLCVYQAHSTHYASRNRASPGRATTCARDAGCLALLGALSFLLTMNLSDSISDEVLGALQTRSRCPPHVTHSSLAHRSHAR